MKVRHDLYCWHYDRSLAKEISIDPKLVYQVVRAGTPTDTVATEDGRIVTFARLDREQAEWLAKQMRQNITGVSWTLEASQDCYGG